MLELESVLYTLMEGPNPLNRQDTLYTYFLSRNQPALIAVIEKAALMCLTANHATICESSTYIIEEGMNVVVNDIFRSLMAEDSRAFLTGVNSYLLTPHKGLAYQADALLGAVNKMINKVCITVSSTNLWLREYEALS